MITFAMLFNQHFDEKVVEIARKKSYTFQEELTPC
jgi:hypothetical protein